ncbi:MAG: hypothetical protein WC254_07375 [Candidatus Woesearchaeota archaeon]|jgi:hypothetical protein
MTQEEINEGLILLIQFMRFEIKPLTNEYEYAYTYWTPNAIIKGEVFFGIEKTENFDIAYIKQNLIHTLKFNTSWDWLMPVCRKWDSIYVDFKPKDIAKRIFQKYTELCEKLDDAVTQYEIKPAFEQLVENVKWYNKNKEQL